MGIVELWMGTRQCICGGLKEIGPDRTIFGKDGTRKRNRLPPERAEMQEIVPLSIQASLRRNP